MATAEPTEDPPGDEPTLDGVLAFADDFRHGQSWGDGGVRAALIRQFDLNSRAAFLQEFAKQAIGRITSKVFQKTEIPAGGGTKS